MLILEGTVEISFPKFIPTKSQKLLSSIKEIRTKDVDTKQLFGLESLKRAAIGDKSEDKFFEFTVLFS